MCKDNLPSVQGEARPTVPVEELGGMIAELMKPVVAAIGKALENNTSALEQLASAQSIQNDRLAELEKQIRLQTPVTNQQVKYLNDAAKKRARELLDKRGISDQKAVMKLAGAIRKAVLARYGISHLREVPKHEYTVAMGQIGMWSDLLTVMDVVKEARTACPPEERT